MRWLDGVVVVTLPSYVLDSSIIVVFIVRIKRVECAMPVLLRCYSHRLCHEAAVKPGLKSQGEVGNRPPISQKSVERGLQQYTYKKREGKEKMLTRLGNMSSGGTEIPFKGRKEKRKKDRKGVAILSYLISSSCTAQPCGYAYLSAYLPT